MEDDKISVLSGVTINTGNFESERIDFTYQRKLQEGEDVKKALYKEHCFVRDIVKEIENKLKPRAKQRRKE